MKYLLDTNICIYFLRGKYNLDKRFNQVGFENFAISEITLAELVFGAENSSNPSSNNKLVEILSEQINTLPIYNAIPFYAKEKEGYES